VTIIATLLMMHRAVEAAALLEKDGISAEVIDPGPSSLRLGAGEGECCEDGPCRHGGGKPEARRRGGGDRRHPGRRDDRLPGGTCEEGGAPNTPAPFSPPMERFYIPDAARIAQAARDLMAIS